MLLLVMIVNAFCPLSAFAIHGEGFAPYEVETLRTATSKTFLLSADGEYEAVVSGNNIHYLLDSGSWADIDNRIVDEEFEINGNQYKYTNFANSYSARFGNIGEGQYGIAMQYQDKFVAFSPLGANTASPTVAYLPDQVDFLSDLIDATASVTYCNVYPQVDIVCEAATNGMKEYIILNSREAQFEFLFGVNTCGLTLTQNEADGLHFVDDDGNTVLDVSGLYAVDAGMVYTDGIGYKLIQGDDGNSQLKLSLDPEFLHSEDRVFPVVIDPSTMVSGSATSDTFVSSACPNRNFNSSSDAMFSYLFAGYDNRTLSPNSQTTATQGFVETISYLKFNLPTGISSSSVTGATLRLRQYNTSQFNSVNCISSAAITSSWTPTSVTWNSGRPNLSAVGGVGAWDINYWVAIGLKDIVKSWYAGSQTNYGVAVRDTTGASSNRYWQFYSSDSNASNGYRPELRIYYTNSTFYGARPYSQSSSTSQNCMGFALNRTSNGVQSWPASNVTINTFLNNFASSAETWMNINLGSANWDPLTSYNSFIASNKYRVALRIIWDDKNNDGIVNANESRDYHWWYQTSDGSWAEKHGTTPSSFVVNSHAVNPGSSTMDKQWTDIYTRDGYSNARLSDVKYYAIVY